MDPTATFKKSITTAIAALPDNTREARQAIYGKSRRFIAFSKYAHLGTALETAITEIENSFDSRPPVLAPEAKPRRARRAFFAPALLFLRRNALVLGGAICVAAVVLFYSLYFGAKGDPDFDQGVLWYSASPIGFESIPSWSSYYSSKTVDGVTLVESKGPVPLYSKQIFAIDPGRKYRLSTRIRVVEDDPAQKGALTSVGIVALDGNGGIIGSDYTAIYPVAMNSRKLTVADGWVEAEGAVSSAGTEGTTQLPPGTVSVRLVVVMNVNCPGAVSQIDYLRFEDLS